MNGKTIINNNNSNENKNKMNGRNGREIEDKNKIVNSIMPDEIDDEPVRIINESSFFYTYFFNFQTNNWFCGIQMCDLKFFRYDAS